ncbi:hypothetical protein SAMN06295960_3216 [Paenibacillus aquistagni]|uniref:Uncharacterized protein n=1 Tax=Paenibacillus aquistagni TaxID=1852522 RepID=A0A1X7LAW9_9BACL|nr:hypothetical protein SAMN06295960_3216 [Paenibacillus aquistagni]
MFQFTNESSPDVMMDCDFNVELTTLVCAKPTEWPTSWVVTHFIFVSLGIGVAKFVSAIRIMTIILVFS